MTHPSSLETTVQPLLRENPTSSFRSETSHPSSPRTTVLEHPEPHCNRDRFIYHLRRPHCELPTTTAHVPYVVEHPGSPSQLELSHISSPQATLQQSFLLEITHSSSPESTVQPLPREDPASPFQSETSHLLSPQATVQQNPASSFHRRQVIRHLHGPRNSVRASRTLLRSQSIHISSPHPSSPQATVQQVLEHSGSPLQSQSIHISYLQATLQQPDPVSPFQSKTSHPSSPQATCKAVFGASGSPSRSELSHISFPCSHIAAISIEMTHPSSLEFTVQPFPREGPTSPFESETSHSSSLQPQGSFLRCSHFHERIQHPHSIETSHPSSPQVTVAGLEHPDPHYSRVMYHLRPYCELCPHPSSPESMVQPLPRENPISPFQSETSHPSSPQPIVQPHFMTPPPLFMHLMLLKLWLERWWIICMTAIIGFLSSISWSIHTSQKNDANIWCTTPNATVTKESNAPSSTEQGAPILFRTIMAAVDATPGDDEWPFSILIQKGVYKERIVIERNKKNFVLVGKGINKTIISSNGGVLSTDRYISELATICKVLGKRFKAKDISFENMGADQLESVALKNSGDESIFHDATSCHHKCVSIHCNHVGQQLYHDSYISGSQHLIYGDGHAMFQRSTIHVNNLKPKWGYDCLQERTSKFLVGGFVFHLRTFYISTPKCT
ncbi:hypothetical protein AAG906_027723 [Vitis piasezkii]